ncbi:MAG: cobalamin-dependent protein, partial [Blastocatellia bacterium]
MKIVLISTYEMGRQPFGLASPAAWLKNAGFDVVCLDLCVQALEPAAVADADLIALHVPMHTATRIATAVLDRLKAVSPEAHLCAYGLYAPVNAEFLRKRGVDTILGGEFEDGLMNLAYRIASTRFSADSKGSGRESEIGHVLPLLIQLEPEISLARQRFVVPDRSSLPPLAKYAHLELPDGTNRTAGYVEASRGCKYLCRHCPVVPVYNGQFRIVQREVVLGDIRQ